MLRSLRLRGLSHDLADEVGLHDALDLEIDEPEAHGDSAAFGMTTAAREDVISPRADAMTTGQGDDALR